MILGGRRKVIRGVRGRYFVDVVGVSEIMLGDSSIDRMVGF